MDKTTILIISSTKSFSKDLACLFWSCLSCPEHCNILVYWPDDNSDSSLDLQCVLKKIHETFGCKILWQYVTLSGIQWKSSKQFFFFFLLYNVSFPCLINSLCFYLSVYFGLDIFPSGSWVYNNGLDLHMTKPLLY